jgi:hypothetical protein
MPFLSGIGMSKQVTRYRSLAANELRESRNGGTAAARAMNVKRAAGYKSLAENQEWLDGEDGRKSSKKGRSQDST